jgi:hypothetical protein
MTGKRSVLVSMSRSRIRVCIRLLTRAKNSLREVLARSRGQRWPVEAAQHGERDPNRLAGIALGSLGPLHREVSQCFGLIPNIFLSTPDAPEIVEKLWDFAKSAYLDSPIPSLFKERLFVFLSRFCQVRYCIVRHCGFLVGYGYASGDARLLDAQ